MSGKRRCLWLMNHRTLRNFEVPLLIDMGFEVFCPKKMSYDEGNLSGDIVYDYDYTLSLPEYVLNILNNVNFYEDISSEIMELLNQYFDISFLAFFPRQLKFLVEGFKGSIILQVFGLENGLTYTKVIADALGISFFDKIESLGERFVFGQAYENISEIECRVLRNRSMYLPCGLSNAYVNNQWVGGDRRILFVCPKINLSIYYKKVYTDFKNNFRGFDYLISGYQPITVKDDAKVTGFVPDDEYEYNMKHLCVMFYHSQEKRHIHYHPFEAIKNGMPLIFMSGGMLDNLGGSNLPGRCKTIKEARKKIKKVMKGDQRFIDRVQRSQEILLEKFTYEYCYKEWNALKCYVEKQITKEEKTAKNIKVAVLLPEAYLGGIWDVTKRFLKSMRYGIEKHHAAVELVFGYIDHDLFDEYTFESIKNMGIPIRKFVWRKISGTDIANIYKIRGYTREENNIKYCVADDGINCFEDCHHIILMGDRVPEYFYTNRPYSVFAHDYIQRYIPSILDNDRQKKILALHRNAEAVYVTTKATREDAVQYAGIKQNRIKLLPFFWKKVDSNMVINCKDRFFLWSTNIGQHKNHLVFLKALEMYYQNGGSFKCVVTGVNTQYFDINKTFTWSNEYVDKIRNMIDKSKILKKNIFIRGNLPKEEYYAILSNAEFLVHPGYIDNGNGSIVDAAFLGVPGISSDYPAMRYMEETMGLHIRFVSPFNYEDWAKMLIQSEQDCQDWKKRLPSGKELEKYLVEYTYPITYETVKDVVRF